MPCTLTSSSSMSQQCQLPRSMMNHSPIGSVDSRKREVRTLKEPARPAHVAAGFHKKLWPISVDFTAKARTFFSLCPILNCKTEAGENPIRSGSWSAFRWSEVPPGALVFYKAKGDWLSEASAKPGIFAGWTISPGMRYKGSLLVLDYESLRNRSHLYGCPSRFRHRKSICHQLTGLRSGSASTPRHVKPREGNCQVNI